MPDYRRAYRPGGTFFFTIVTNERRPLFGDPGNVHLLRDAVREVKQDRPFEIVAAVVLPEHLHFIWVLPEDDSNYSWRIGRMKVSFTKAWRALRGNPVNGYIGPEIVGEGREMVGGAHPTSRRRHRESDLWQRRFWEHTIRDERDLANHLHYIHYNPVKHAICSCPHAWPHSSFSRWVADGGYETGWCCACQTPVLHEPYPAELTKTVGE